VRQLVAGQPDITLAELENRLTKRKITVGKSSISRFLHHLKLPFKKSLRAAEQDRPDVAAARRALQRRQTKLDPRRLVFIDETSVSTTTRKLEEHYIHRSIASRLRYRALCARRRDEWRDVQGLRRTTSLRL
jgi:hypothetical protein